MGDVDCTVRFLPETSDHRTSIPELVEEISDTLTSLSLTEYKIEGKKFPEILTYLSLYACDIEASDLLIFSWPDCLKELNLVGNPLKDLTGVMFPLTLKLLLLKDCEIGSLVFTIFPNLLESLGIRNNPIRDLDGVIFPNLKKRFLSSSSFSSLSGRHFPESLENLKGDFTGIKWKEAGLLNNLRKLSGRVNNENFSFSPHLEQLNLVLGKDVDYSKFLLPKTVKNLSLKGGNSSYFDWKLPFLKELHLEDFHGSVQVPHTVTRLMLKSEYHNSEKSILHEGIEHLGLSCQLTQYQLSLKKLEFWKFTSKSLYLDIPNLTELKIQAISNLQVSIPVFPAKRRFIDGRFHIATMERFYSIQG